MLKLYEDEVKILRYLDHPNIINIFDELNDKETNGLGLVTTLCEGGELFDKIQELEQFTEKQAAQVMQ